VSDLDNCKDTESFKECLDFVTCKSPLDDFSKKLKELYLNIGELPDLETLKILKFFDENTQPIKDDFWEQVAAYFVQEFKNISDDKSEKYIYNTLILLAQFFTQGYKLAIYHYVQRTILLDTRHADKQNKWVRSFEYFLLHINPPLKIVLEAIEESIQLENFFHLGKESQRSIFYWWLHVIWTHPSYMNHPLWKECQLSLKKLSDEVLKRGDIVTQMYIHFFAYHLLGNLYQTSKEWKDFNQEFNKSQCKAFESLHVKPCKTKVATNKKKIVFVKDRIVENAPFKVEYSLLTALMKDENFTNNYEAYVLSMGYIDKAHDQERELRKLRMLGLNVVSPAQFIHAKDEYYNHLEKAIILHNWFVENEIDIMVGCVSGYDIMNFLFASRSAPKQIYWSHGDFEYDVKGIDKRISHFYRDNPYKYEKFDVSILDEFHKPNEKKYEVEAQEIRKRWSEDTIILGSIGRLIKMDNDEYISAIATILKENPNTIYLACGTGNEESIKQKLVKYNIPMDRFFFEGFVNAHVYGYIIDIYLNTFPEPSGEAVGEFLTKGEDKFVVSMEI